MANITLKNIPDKAYELLKERAKRNQRSINSEIIMAIKIHMHLEKPNPDEILAKAREFRSKIKVKLSPEEIENAINGVVHDCG
jgi:plasmid stability protein